MTNTSDLPDIRKQLGDRYAIERELGRGGMGAVYLARDLRLDRPVALKVLPAELAQDSSLRERFLRETRTAASFSHPNIVPVHAVEDRDGILAFAMGFVEGESVAERVKRAGPLEVRSVVRLLQDILGAVVITRALMVSSEARRLAVIGYRPDDVLNGLRATVDEREAQRQQLRADPDTRRRRRKTVIAAVLLLPIAFLLINASLNVGFSLGTKAEVVQTESRDATQRSLGRLVMAASGLSLLGVGFLLLARSPFRMPPAERLFRVLWLGAPGRTFVRFSSRNVAPPSSGKTALGLAGTRANVNIAEAGRAAALVVATKATPTDQMRSLEDRVAALERWRDGAST